MELKTLKDIKTFLSKDDPYINTYDKQIRREAVKWVKRYREINSKDKRIDKKDVDVKGVQLGANYLIQEWIINFFNLSEEDLNDK